MSKVFSGLTDILSVSPISCFLLSEARIIKVHIISDSMAKHVTDIRHAEVIAFPGINISRLANKIQSGHLRLDRQFTIIHVGTNDIQSHDAGAILSSYNNLITVIKQFSDTSIVMSGIIPRPVDHQVTGDKVKLVNNRLKQLCKQRNIKYLHTFKPFIKHCQPLRELFAVRDQGLHLNLEGIRRLRFFFINSVAHLIRK